MALGKTLFNVASSTGSALKQGFKTLSSSKIKTSSHLVESAPALTKGGRSVATEGAKNVAKGVGNTAEVGGKVANSNFLQPVKTTGKWTAAIAVPVVGGSAMLDYAKKNLWHSPEYYEGMDDNKVYAEETENLKERLDILKDISDSGVGGDSSQAPNYMVGGVTRRSNGESGGGSAIPTILSVIAVGGVGYLLYKNMKKRGKK